MTRRSLAAVFTLLLLTAPALAQEPAPAPAPAQKAEPVRLSVTFSDDKGRPAEVRREDVRVFVDGVEQPVTHFEREDAPASYGLVVDNSGSLRFLINYVVASAIEIVEANRPGDETFVVRFVSSDRVQLLTDFTADKALLRKALEGMFIEGGQTALVDALYHSAEYLEKNAARGAGEKNRRRVLVLISDGEDRESDRKLDELLKLLKRARIQVHCIGLVGGLENESRLISQNKRDKAVALLKRLANETDGRLLLVNKVESDLRQAVASIVGDLRTTYVIGYTPVAPPGDKPRGKVEVKVLDRKGAPKLKAVVLPPADAEVAEPKKKG